MQFDAPGGPHSPDNPVLAGITTVSPDYFRVMGIPIIAGRAFADTDVPGGPAVAIVNAAAARQLFDGQPAIGREIRIYGAKPSTVVGVVRDSKYASVVERDVPAVFLNLQQDIATGGVSVVVRTSRAAAMVPMLRDAVQQVDPHVALYDARAVSDQVDAALAPQRFGAVLLGVFSVIGLSVAAVGIYSVVGCTVARRTSELGIRVALGATSVDVLRAVLRGTGASIVAGLLLGLAISVPVSTALGRFLIGVPPLDRWSFASAVALLLGSAVVAIAGPSRRAIQADPLLTLRSE
jgi:putative ABC transport system permease protein